MEEKRDIGQANLQAFGREIAESLKPTGRIHGRSEARRILANLRRVKAVYKKLTAEAAEQGSVPEEVEWLLDNWYIAEREGKEAALRLKDVPKLRGVPNGQSVLSALSRGLVGEKDGAITLACIKRFFDGVQAVYLLSEKEVSLLVSALKAALIAHLMSLSGNLRSGTVEGLADQMNRVFTSLRLLASLDLREDLDEISQTEQILRLDPAGVYTRMDDETRGRYRRQISYLARRHKMEEHQVARRVLELAQAGEAQTGHVGYYLFTRPLGKRMRARRGSFYIGSIVVGSLFLALFVGALLRSILVAALLVVPISEIIKNLADFCVIKSTRPRHIPRKALKEGVPNEGRTLCVISMLLDSEQAGETSAAKLEEYYLANRNCGKNLIFGLLADLPESEHAALPDAKDWIDRATAALEGLNKKHDAAFLLLHRERKYNAQSKRYMGWERKRGAILELTRLITGKEHNLQVQAGSKLALAGVRYIIALDADTRLNVGAAREMIGAMLHPLNMPVIDEVRGVVREGTALLQPRMGVDLKAAGRSDFTRIFAGQGGIDPYGSAASDVYQDLFGEGSFAGKGIFDVHAFSLCLDQTFPENRILSHDLLEGAYLKAGYLGDVELTDGYPYKVLSYFTRMHRWTRGDWQSAPWIRGKVRRGDGRRVKNPLNLVNRWKIFDNLRRSMVPVFTMLALLAAMFVSTRSLFWAGVIAVLSPLSGLLISSAERVLRRESEQRVRYHSTIIAGFAGGFLETVSCLIFLPYHAYITLSGALTALWRMCVTKRNMLSWVTSADAEAKTGTGIIHHYYKMFPAVLIACAAIFLSGSPFKIAVGIVWLLSPLYALRLSRERKDTRKVTDADKKYLLEQAGEIWRYFEDFIGPEDHFLPPDNWQEQPAAGIAHRTSPTNIGLALLSALAALDLGLCPKHKPLGMIENMLATMERMEKWNGHLYNWVDTRSLKPLHPVYVSAVDSGNLSGCLLVLREGLYEMGQIELAQRADKLFSDMAFDKLYDKKRGLFHIGWDLEKDAPTEGWYDLLASEARQTSYIAIARGDVEPRHWRRLGRSLVSQDQYSGMASWTGTMFEYLMPQLLMPCYKDSLLYESSKFCVHVQKKRSTPWGISESAFYAFDPALNYSYKAHGVQRLALKRGMNKELVISPYSTFLALPMDLKAAIGNLRRLEKYGAKGKYGFYEALDFTPTRRAGRDCQIVRTYMVHHLGMSLLAISNLLTDNAMQTRFMQDRAMSAYRELLQEKVPIGGVTLRQPAREVPEKPKRLAGDGWSVEYTEQNVFHPASTILSNGAYSVVVTETGHSRSMAGETMVCRFEPRQDGQVQGIGFYWKTSEGIYPLQTAPDFDQDARRKARFTGEAAELTVSRPGLESEIRITVPPDELGEARTVTLRNQGDTPLEGELICYTEPALAPPADYFAHPAFSKLSMETELVGADSISAQSHPSAQSHQSHPTLLVRRRSNGIRPESYLALTVACRGELRSPAGGKTPPLRYDTSREATLGRAGLYTAMEQNAQSTEGTVLDPCILTRMTLEIPAGEAKFVTFALAVGKRRTETVEAARRIASPGKYAETERFVEGRAQTLGLSQEEITEAMATVSALVYPFTGSSDRGKHITPQSGGQRDLWVYGISGDLPLVTAQMGEADTLEIAERLIRRYSFLRQCGLHYDLVFLTADSGDYRRPIHTGIHDLLRDMGLENHVGARGGVHLVDDSGNWTQIFAASAIVYDKDGTETKTQTSNNPPRRGELRSPACHNPANALPTYHYDQENAIVIDTANDLLPNTWSHMLANDRYGYIATDSGTGHMWQINARENKITPWRNDTLETRGAERLTLLRGECEISLFADADGLDCKITYGFGFARWEKTIDESRITVTAFVPTDTEARVFLVEGNLRADDKIAYFAELVLGEGDKNRAYVVTTTQSQGMSAQNGSNGEFPGLTVSLTATTEPEGYTCDRQSWARRELDRKSGAGLDPCFYAVYPSTNQLAIVTGTGSLHDLLPLTNPDKARATLEQTCTWWRDRVGGIGVQTGVEPLDHYLSGWALYQSLACRVMGRSSVYQSGGAYGFRDQLQDVTALIAVAPEVAKDILKKAAAHQFEEGDVQHWWHPSGLEGVADKGVRTRCSDDLLFLPYVLCEYVEKTGDTSICHELAPYIRSPILEDGEHERYESPVMSELNEPLFRHAERALDLAIRRGTGVHGLARMGTGDWNDGMNLVGAGGRGESVWLSWFLAHVADRFAALCTRLGEDGADRYIREAERFGKAANEAWDGDWYLRGYYDNGKTLGSHADEECQVDAIAQGFATMTRHSDPRRVRHAIITAADRLFDREAGVVRLFDPAFSNGKTNPGYIRGYAPGLRENGGQYTHGCLWLAMGAFKAGLWDLGYDMLSAMLPGNHDTAAYRGEPYVIAADVYANEQHLGRAGWTWYTGASAWYWRVAMEELLGLRLRDGKLYIEPSLPQKLDGYSVQWGKWHIRVEGDRITVNGAPYDGQGIAVYDEAKQEQTTS